MLYFLVNERHDYTIRWFLEDWGRGIADRVRVIHYRRFLKSKRMRAGSYVFSDIERITPWGLERLEARWHALVGSGRCPILLNDPTRVCKRLPLLNRLHDAGINRFNAYPVPAEGRVTPERFPVFVREANSHIGPYDEDLIENQDALDAALERYRTTKRLTQNPVVIEYVDTSDASGLFRKYAAFRIGEHMVPTHMYVNDHWFVKSTNSALSQALVDEEWHYVENNPHAGQLFEIFDMAGIEYGRIDYALLDGRIQVFEINTNPVVMRTGMPANDARVQRKQFVADRLMAAFCALDRPRRRAESA